MKTLILAGLVLASAMAWGHPDPQPQPTPPVVDGIEMDADLEIIGEKMSQIGRITMNGVRLKFVLVSPTQIIAYCPRHGKYPCMTTDQGYSMFQPGDYHMMFYKKFVVTPFHETDITIVPETTETQTPPGSTPTVGG